MVGIGVSGTGIGVVVVGFDVSVTDVVGVVTRAYMYTLYPEQLSTLLLSAMYMSGFSSP